METFKHIQHKVETNDVPKSQVGVVPIFGGISWTEYDITQTWYPSNNYHDKKGVLTGAYNFGDIAAAWGEKPIDERLAGHNGIQWKISATISIN